MAFQIGRMGWAPYRSFPLPAVVAIGYYGGVGEGGRKKVFPDGVGSVLGAARGASDFGYRLSVISYQENLPKNNQIRAFFTISHSSRN
jgi:hypothetical protein